MKNSSGQNKTEISLKHEIAALKKQLYELEDSNKNAISKNEYYSIYHNVPVGIMHFDEKGILLDCNDAFVDMIGSSREELIGLDMINQLSDNDLIDALKLSLQSGEGRYEDIYKSISAHKETPARILFKGLRNEKNKIYGGICIAEDLTETLKTQRALKETEENYKLIFENTNDVYYRTTKEGTFLSLNPAVKDLLFVNNIEDIIGKNVIDIYANPSDRHALLDKLEKNGYVQAYLIELKRQDGTTITVELNSKFVYNKQGEVDSIVGVFHDVTNRLVAEKERLTHLWFLERLEIINETIRIAIDENEFLNIGLTTLIEAFQCDNALIFTSENELTNSWRLRTLVKSDTNTCDDKVDYFIKNSIKDNEIFNRISMYRNLIVNDDDNIGEISELSKSMGVKAQMIMPLYLNTESSIIFCVNHCKDARIWNKHEKALFVEIANRLTDAINSFESSELLYKSEKYHRSMIEATSEGYFEVDDSGIIIVANNAMCKMIGYSSSEFINEPYLKFVTPISKKFIEEQRFNKETIHLSSFNVELKHKNGNIIYTLSNITRRKSEDNKNLGAFFFVTDISHQKKIELEKEDFRKELEKTNIELEELNLNLKTALSKAEESDKLKTLFIKNISHEVRTPLNGIIGFIEILSQEDITKEERQEFTSYIIASSDQLTTIISDILEFSKLEAGQIKLAPSEFYLNDMIDELYSHFDSLIISKNKTHIRFLSDKPLYDKDSKVTTDSGKIKQVLSNLISNAIKFTLEGEIKYGYKINNGSITFFVTDSGVGIPISDREIIFDKFRQGAYTDSAVYGGNGLGLTISKSLTDLLGGKIWFNSEVGKGTEFYFTVPGTNGSDNMLSKKPPLYNWSNKKILIVDDVLEVYQLLSIYLRETKAKQLYAETGIEAIELCKQNPDIDLVLLDIQLPDIDGFETFKKIKQIRNEIPVIAQTAFALNSDKERAMLAGFSDYITKPIYKKTLLKHISKFF